MAGNIEVVPYKVKKGDSFWNIVKAAGFPPNDWEKIYKAPYNKKIKSLIEKEKRTPDTIFPGEIIYVPAFTKADIQAKTKEIKNLQAAISKSLVVIGVYDKLLARLKKEKDAKIKEKKATYDALVKERDKLDKLIVEGAGSLGQESTGGGKARVIWTRYYNRKHFGVHNMTKKIAELKKNLETTKYDASIKTLEGQAKQARKELSETAAAAAEDQKELSKMLQNPY